MKESKSSKVTRMVEKEKRQREAQALNRDIMLYHVQRERDMISRAEREQSNSVVNAKS